MKKVKIDPPIKLDKIDKKLILLLYKNGRESFNNLGKELNVSKEVVKYRYEKLIKLGIIEKIIPVIDYFKLGYNIYRLHIKLEPIDSEKVEEMINFLKELSVIKLIDKIYGKWDFLLHIYSKSITEFLKIYNQILEKYGDIIEDLLFTIINEINYFSPNFVLENSKRVWTNISISEKRYNLSDIEEFIIKELSKNGRETLVNISLKISSSVNNVSYHLKELLKKGIIKNFIPVINPYLLGYQKFNLKIVLEKPQEKKILFNELKTNPNIIQIVESIGKYNLEIECYYENITELLRLIKEISKLSKIKDYEIIFDNDEIITLFEN